MNRAINNNSSSETIPIRKILSMCHSKIPRIFSIPTTPTMDLQLKGKTALIMAASKGLGKACAAALAAEGADIVIGARNAETLERTATELRSLGKGRVVAVPVDVRDALQTAGIVSAAATTF